MGNMCGGPPKDQGRARSNTEPGPVASNESLPKKKGVRFGDDVVDKNQDEEQFN
jgi:hypothetical protein